MSKPDASFKIEGKMLRPATAKKGIDLARAVTGFNPKWTADGLFHVEQIEVKSKESCERKGQSKNESLP